NDRAQARLRPAADQPFSEIKDPSGDDVDAGDPFPGMDAAGNALVAWFAGPGPPYTIEGRIYDAAAPQPRELTVPPTGTVGVPVDVSVSPFDQWSPFTTGWAFGDGGTAEGNAASHVYGAPGEYDVAVTATDAAGNAAVETRRIGIAAPPAPPLPPPPVAVIASVSDLGVSPRTFAAAARGASVAQRRRRTGTRVTYDLNVAADVRFTVRRRARGRRVGGRCVKPTRRNRSKRRCARFVRVRGSFARASTAGANRFRFTGRLRGRKLRPGRYRLVATPRAGTVAGPARRAAFRIVRRRR
ncbi:MAG TPA: PKD domain-containing protein, partial [Solirubrobacteraceae bacterium]